VGDVDPTIVREAIQLGLVDRQRARKYLDVPESPRKPWLTPAVPPPPERLRPIVRPDRTIRRPTAARTKALLKAGLIPRRPDVADATPPPEEPP
jgi:hypothetical protein